MDNLSNRFNISGYCNEHRAYFEESYVKTPFFRALTPERSAKETNELIRLCNFSSDDLILDLGCGQGRHCFELKKRGYKPIGCDYSATLLKIGQSENMKRNLDVSFVRGNMSHLPFYAETFNWVLSLFGSFGYFDDIGNQSVLKEMCRVLKDRGRLLLDFWNKDYALNHLAEEEKYNTEDTGYLIQTTEYSPENKRVTRKRFFFGPDGKISFKISYRLYTPEEIADSLRSVGLGVFALYGNYSGAKLTPDSRSMVIIAEKSG
nr:class I SAM-dependent methyltransferase [candidate division Zixibacteria bacterium]